MLLTYRYYIDIPSTAISTVTIEKYITCKNKIIRGHFREHEYDEIPHTERGCGKLCYICNVCTSIDKWTECASVSSTKNTQTKYVRTNCIVLNVSFRLKSDITYYTIQDCDNLFFIAFFLIINFKKSYEISKVSLILKFHISKNSTHNIESSEPIFPSRESNTMHVDYFELKTGVEGLFSIFFS